MNKERLVYSVLSAVMFISGAALLVYYYWANGYIDMPVPQGISEEEVEYTNPSLPKTIEPTVAETTEEEPAETTGEYETHTKYTSSIDFEQLKKTNSEIIGWMQMTGPEISAPILMSETDDAFYLSHGPNGKYSKRGSFFIEKTFNKPDFDDPVTIIYGHRKSDGSMFGSLQKTLEKIDIKEDPQYIEIYLPNSTKIYRIVATIRHDSSHVLSYNDFSLEAEYENFFDKVYSSKGTGVQLVAEERPEYGDNVLILSTCFKTDRTQRFLVIAKELT